LAGLTLLTGWATLRMPVVAASFSVSDTFTISAALLFGPAAGAVTVMLDGLTMWFRLSSRSRTPLRLVFNMTAPTLAMWVSAHAFFAMSGTGPLASQPGAVREVLGPLALFATLYFLLNTGLVATAVAFERGTSVIPVWREHFSMLWLTYFGGASIAALVLLTMAARVAEAITLALIAPLLMLLYATFKKGIDQIREKLEHVAQLSTYTAALRSTADGVLVTDSIGRITLMNPTAERLTGWTERDARGRSEGEVLRLQDAHPRHDGESASRGADEHDVREYKLIRADGTELSIEAGRATVRDEEQNAIGVIRTFRDVSQRAAIEAQREALLQSERRAREAADEANRMKDEFLAMLSHELRTPATAVLGWTRLLKTGRMDEAGARKALDALERSAQAQEAVLNDLLDMSRIVSGTLRLSMRKIDIVDCVRDAAATIEPALLAKNISLGLTADENVPLIDADPDRLRQVFWNVLVNAVKFSDDGGSIGVNIAAQDGYVRIDVVDSGSGIRAEVLPFIFEPFRQGDSSSTRAHAGLGLGLAIVRHVVDLHEGTVAAASEGEGHGARFTVRLPVARRQAMARPVQAVS
jgi:PAS domain S-box-containing protein